MKCLTYPDKFGPHCREYWFDAPWLLRQMAWHFKRASKFTTFVNRTYEQSSKPGTPTVTIKLPDSFAITKSGGVDTEVTRPVDDNKLNRVYFQRGR